MKKIAAFAGLIALTPFAWSQLADMITLPDAAPTAEAPAPAPKPEVEFSDEEMLQTWGWLLADRFNLGGFDFTEAEVGQIHAGISAYVKGLPPPTDPNVSMTSMQQYFVDREERVIAARKVKFIEDKKINIEKELDFFDTLFGQPGVQALGSGLHYQILVPGSDKRPKPSDTVIVNYEGRFLDNTVFDSSVGRGPATFKLNQVIDAWTQAVPLIGEGGKIKIFAPYKLAYGEDGNGGSIPPAATLVFEIELLKVVDSAKVAEPAPAAE